MKCLHLPKCSVLVKKKGFWIVLILFLSLGSIFISIGSISIKKDLNYIQNKQNKYKQINATINEYDAIDVPCKCSNYKRGIYKLSKCPWYIQKYTGVILVQYKISNDTFFDEERVICGENYKQAITNAKLLYPIDQSILMYYDIADPDGGVVFNITFSNTYKTIIITSFIMAFLCILLSLLAFLM